MLSKVLVVGSSGFIGRNLIEYLNLQGRLCVTVSRNVSNNESLNHILLKDFENFNYSDFEKYQIEEIIYSLGDPNMNGVKNTETVILEKFLNKLEEFQFKGKFLLISSNAANPDSGLTSFKYRKTLRNTYIERKQMLESIALSSNLQVVIVRSPAVIGVDMNEFSHVKRILRNKFIGKTMSLPIFRGTIEVITIENLCKEVQDSLKNCHSKAIVEPSSPSYRWYRVARFLVSGRKLDLEKISILNRFQQRVSSALPISIRFLFFPHWVNKSGNDSELLSRHKDVLGTLSAIKNLNESQSKCMIVTGAASGLGAEVTKLLLQKNHKVVGVDILEPNQNSQILQFQEDSNFKYICGDLASSKFLGDLEEFIEFNSVDGVFSIAGIGKRKSVEDLQRNELLEVLGVNFFAQASLAQSLLRINRPGSFFVYLGSSSGIEGLPNFAAYSASKAAVQAYFFSLICELKEPGFRILGVIPSGMKTNFQKANDVPSSKLDKFLLDDPAKVARFILDWVDEKNKKSQVKYFGVSSRLFLFVRNLPFSIKLNLVKSISKGTR
jgi:short-subunit dehydrogenase